MLWKNNLKQPTHHQLPSFTPHGIVSPGGGPYALTDIIQIIILCSSINSSDVNSWSTPLQESCHRSATVTADYYSPDSGCLLDFFFNPSLKNCWHGWLGIAPTTLDLCHQPGAFDYSATTTPGVNRDWLQTRWSHLAKTQSTMEIPCLLN